LLCSDGLTDMVDDVSLAHILASDRTMDAMADECIRQANEQGGRDNVSVLLVKVAEAAPKKGFLARWLRN